MSYLCPRLKSAVTAPVYCINKHLRRVRDGERERERPTHCKSTNVVCGRCCAIIHRRSFSPLHTKRAGSRWVTCSGTLRRPAHLCSAVHWICFIGPILWGHSGPLCHALSLSLALWTSMRRRRATVATPGELQCRTGGVRRLAVANGPNIFQMLLVLYTLSSCFSDFVF